MNYRKTISLLIIMALFCNVFSFGTSAATYPNSDVFINYEKEFERGITVVPDGSVYSIVHKDGVNTTGYLTGFDKNGDENGISIKMPSKYAGNLCSDKDGTIFGHSFSGALYYFKHKNDSVISTAYLEGGNASALTVDSEGNLYKLTTINVSGKSKVKIYKFNASKIKKLSDGAEVESDKNYLLNYTPPNKSGNCYPAGFAVDDYGNVYIADRGDSTGSSGSVNGIYKCNLNNGKVTDLYFSSDKTIKLTWLKGVAIDEVGNVVVLSRNSKVLAKFAPGKTTAELANFTGWVDDLAMSADGEIYIASSGGSSGNVIYKYTINNVRVTGITLSESENKLKVGDVFKLNVQVNPANATNKFVYFVSSKNSVVRVDDNGQLSAVSVGTSIITAKSYDGSKTDTCTVTVIEGPTNSSKIKDVKAKSTSYNSVKLNWSSVKGADGYIIYRSENKNGSYKQIKILSSKYLSYSDTKLSTGKNYFYKLKAYKTSDKKTTYSSFSTVVQVKPIPNTPNLSVKKDKKIKLSWKKIKGASGYIIYRATKKGGSYNKLSSLSDKKTSFTDKKATAEKVYYYKMKAFRISGSKKVYSGYSKIRHIKF